METGSAGHELVVVVNPISVPAMSILNSLSVESPPLPIESRSPYITKSGYECKKPARFMNYKCTLSRCNKTLTTFKIKICTVRLK